MTPRGRRRREGARAEHSLGQRATARDHDQFASDRTCLRRHVGPWPELDHDPSVMREEVLKNIRSRLERVPSVAARTSGLIAPRWIDVRQRRVRPPRPNVFDVNWRPCISHRHPCTIGTKVGTLDAAIECQGETREVGASAAAVVHKPRCLGRGRIAARCERCGSGRSATCLPLRRKIVARLGRTRTVAPVRIRRSDAPMQGCARGSELDRGGHQRMVGILAPSRDIGGCQRMVGERTGDRLDKARSHRLRQAVKDVDRNHAMACRSGSMR